MRFVVKSLMLSLPTPGRIRHSFSRCVPRVTVSLPKSAEDVAQRAVQRVGELLAEAGAVVAEQREAEPVLLDLLEPVPGVDQAQVEVRRGAVAQEAQVVAGSRSWSCW